MPTYFHAVNDVSVQKTMSVYVIFNNIPSASGGLRPQNPTTPLDPAGDFRPPDPLVAPPLQKFPRAPIGAPTFFSEQGPVLS